MISKDSLRKKFNKEWEKHYKVKAITSKGYVRKQCKSCKKFFWTLDESREKCADSSCVGYEFIGKKGKNLDYVETWKKVEKYFKENGHTPIKRYPTVCRWRDDLYFTNASIIDFQPYVVTGEVKAPANPLIVPQASLRFGDLGNVGVTGRHYTSFIMIGQHAFNTPETKLFYWKDEALEHDYNFVTKHLGVDPEELVWQEEVWKGGGTFGPCIEYCVSGIELGNCVFMQYKDLGFGRQEELKTKVIDMGAGLERFAWFTQGTPTSYEVTFGPVIQKMKKDAGIYYDKKLFLEYAKLSGILDVDEQNVKEEREEIARKLGVDEKQLFDMLKPLQSLYATADHLKTILYTTTDGMLPGNSGGGYNLRMILRKVFGSEEEFAFNLDYSDIIRGHANYLKKLDPSLQEGVDSTIELVELEKKKFLETKQHANRKMKVIIDKAKKEKKEIKKEQLITLYESDGIPLEIMEEHAKKQGLEIEEMDNFYGMITQKNEIEMDKKKSNKKKKNVSKYKKTRMLFYEDHDAKEFKAKVIGKEKGWIILDKTAFYPEGGGQKPDKGMLNDLHVKDVQKEEGVILHKVDKPKRIKVGDKVKGMIDWERRLILRNQHTGAHILQAAAKKVLGNHVWQAGAEKDVEKAHLDITHFKKINDLQVKKIEKIANKFIQSNRPVTAKFYPRNEAEELFGFTLYQGGAVPGKEIRVINVEGIDAEACGGMHANRTGEIGFFKIIKREGIKDGVERIVYATGLSALKHVWEEEEIIRETAEIMNVPEVELDTSAKKIMRQWRDQRKLIDGMRKQLVESLSKDLIERKNDKIYKFFQELDNDSLMVLAQKILSERANTTVIFGSEDGGILIMNNNKGENAKKEFDKLAKILNCKGGGNEKIARGKTEKTDELKYYLEKRAD